MGPCSIAKIADQHPVAIFSKTGTTGSDIILNPCQAYRRQFSKFELQKNQNKIFGILQKELTFFIEPQCNSIFVLHVVVGVPIRELCRDCTDEDAERHLSSRRRRSSRRIGRSGCFSCFWRSRPCNPLRATKYGIRNRRITTTMDRILYCRQNLHRAGRCLIIRCCGQYNRRASGIGSWTDSLLILSCTRRLSFQSFLVLASTSTQTTRSYIPPLLLHYKLPWIDWTAVPLNSNSGSGAVTLQNLFISVCSAV